MISDFGLDIKTFRTINKRHAYAFGYQLSHSDVSIDLIKEEPADPQDNQLLLESDRNFKNAAFGEYSYTTNHSGLWSAGLRLVPLFQFK